MANCPKCQTELLQDSGLALCSSCGHPSVINIDGSIQEMAAEPTPQPSAHADETSDPAIASIAFMQNESAGSPPTSGFSLFEGDAPQPQAASQNDPFENVQQGSESVSISEYANSELSQGKNGAFVYNVSIQDIDSKEIREYLREAINDARFNWDVSAIISQIKDGELLLRNLSPVKASILINRIKRLPVKIRWEQYAITQAEQNSLAP